jgi:hypothetical protein
VIEMTTSLQDTQPDNIEVAVDEPSQPWMDTYALSLVNELQERIKFLEEENVFLNMRIEFFQELCLSE